MADDELIGTGPERLLHNYSVRHNFIMLIFLNTPLK